MNLGSLPLLDRLSASRRILLAGAGGGFDIMAGIPLFEFLRGQGKQVFLASLSFSELARARARKLPGEVWEVRGDAGGDDNYFPEKYLSQYYADKGLDVPVYCFHARGAAGISQVYESLVKELKLDALVLVDGGTDSLMRGDEPGLGSPAEDMCSIAAAHALDLPVRLLVNLGFGVDTFHGVCHAYVLEAVADLTAQGAFLGAFSLLPNMPEFQALAQATAYIHQRMPGRESIVVSSVISAGEGRFGDYHSLESTRDSTLFINHLMSMYWCFEIDGVARRCLYLDFLTDTHSRWDVHRAISNFLFTIKDRSREWMNIPL